MSNTYMPLYGVFDTTTGALQGVCPVSGVTSSISGQPVSITGTTTVGSVLTAALATGWTAGGYQWTRDGANISGATSATYTLVSGDSGHTVGVTVSTLVYAPTGQTIGAASPVAPVITAVPVISAITAGSAVTWTTGTATGTPTPTLTYALKKNGTVVSSPATSGAYSTTTAGDIFIVTLTATNSAGTASQDSAQVTVTSGASLRFAAANNYFASQVGSYLIGNVGGTTSQLLQQGNLLIGQDCTSVTIGFSTQYMKATFGISNIGNGINFLGLTAIYNGIVVNVTLSSSAAPFTVADISNALFDAIPASAFSVAKFTKGTTIQIKALTQSTTVSTDKYPYVGTSNTIYGATASSYLLDPTMVSIVNGVSTTASNSYSAKTFTSSASATASGTTVTVLLSDTSMLVSGRAYNFSGATGTGNQLFYNTGSASVVISINPNVSISYTAPSGAPSASMTGTLTIKGNTNGNTDLKFGQVIPFILLATHSLPSVGLFGDSKTYGTGSVVVPAAGTLGMSRLFLSDPTNITTVVCSGCNFGNPSGWGNDLGKASGSGNVSLFEAWYAYANYAIVGYGTNAQTAPYNTALYTRLRAVGPQKIVQRSLTPQSISTVANTTVVGNGTLVTVTVPSSFITNLGLTTGQTFTGVVAGVVPSGYNTSTAGVTCTVASASSFTYVNATSSTVTTLGVSGDLWSTVGNQTAVTGWSSGGAADTFEQTLKALPASDANLAYYQSLGERSATSGTGYWLWAANGTTPLWDTADGKHESDKGYEDYITTGQIVSQSGTVTQGLRAYVATLT